MTQAKVNQIVADRRAEGKTDAEIRKELFRTKGVRLQHIQRAGV